MQTTGAVTSSTEEHANEHLRAAHLQALRDEEDGVRHRIQHFYLPLFLNHARAGGKSPESMRILDCGCGNGASVECLAAAGFEAFGIDIADFRVQQWTGRATPPASTCWLRMRRRYRLLTAASILSSVVGCSSTSVSLRAARLATGCRRFLVRQSCGTDSWQSPFEF